MEKNNEKRVLNIELSEDVKKVSITGTNGEEKVVMRQELNEDELEIATGGNFRCVKLESGYCTPVFSVVNHECEFD